MGNIERWHVCTECGEGGIVAFVCAGDSDEPHITRPSVEFIPASRLRGAVARVVLVEAALKSACQDLGLNEDAPARYIEEAERGLALRGGQCAASRERQGE